MESKKLRLGKTFLILQASLLLGLLAILFMITLLMAGLLVALEVVLFEAWPILVAGVTAGAVARVSTKKTFAVYVVFVWALLNIGYILFFANFPQFDWILLASVLGFVGAILVLWDIFSGTPREENSLF